jgi:hypothetical protein
MAGNHDIGNRAPDHFFSGIAENALRAAVPTGDHAVQVITIDPVG